MVNINKIEYNIFKYISITRVKSKLTKEMNDNLHYNIYIDADVAATIAKNAALANDRALLAYRAEVVAAVAADYTMFKVDASQDATNAAFTALIAANNVVVEIGGDKQNDALTAIVLSNAAVVSAQRSVSASVALIVAVETAARDHVNISANFVSYVAETVENDKDVIAAIELADKTHEAAVKAIDEAVVANRRLC